MAIAARVGVGVVFVGVALVLVSGQAQQRFNQNYRIASIESRPFLRQKDNTSEGNEKFEGFIKDLLDEIKNVSSFDYTLQLSEEETYGQEYNGSGYWTGLIGMAQRQEIDVIAADLTVTWKRKKVLDFSMPFMASTLTVLMKRWDSPPPASLSDSSGVGMESWFGPYSWEVWLLLLAAYIVTGLVLWLVGRISPKEKNPASTATPLTIRDAYWYLIACWFRASSFHPNAWSTRLVSCCWWMFYLTVILTYFLLLPPHLAQPPLSANPNMVKQHLTVNQLINDDITFGVVHGGSTHQLLENSYNPVHKDIWSSIEQNPNNSLVRNYNEGYSRVMNERGFGMLMEDTGAKYFMARHCDLYTVGELQDRHFAFGFQKARAGAKNPLKVLFSGALRRIAEQGKVSLLRNKWWPQNENCGRGASGSVQENHAPVQEIHAPRTTLGPGDLWPPLVFLLVALILGLLISLIELMMHLSTIAYPVHDKSFRENEKAPSFIGSLKIACCPCLQSKDSQPMVYKNMRPSVATQTVLWASSRATTPTPHSPHGTLSQRIF